MAAAAVLVLFYFCYCSPTTVVVLLVSVTAAASMAAVFKAKMVNPMAAIYCFQPLLLLLCYVLPSSCNVFYVVI